MEIKGLKQVVQIEIKAEKIEAGTKIEKLWKLTAMQIEVVKMKA